MSAITRDPETRGGEPCIAGTRIPVALLLAELGENSIVEFAADRDLSTRLCYEVLEEAVAEYEKFDYANRPGTWQEFGKEKL